MWPFSRKRPVDDGRSAYEFTFTQLTGGMALPLSDFEGKAVLVVNTASKCGFTPQYKGLEALYKSYKDKGLVVLGVPSDDFAHQEPGGNADIATFCERNYGVSFPMAAKEHVKGEAAHPFYAWVSGNVGRPKWNFHKYLIDRKGRLVDYFNSTTTPTSKKLIQAIDKALSAS